LARRAGILAALAVVLCVPAAARANGDPASDYLLAQNLFLPFDAKVDQGAVKQLTALLQAADKSEFRIRVAIIKTRNDLGTAFSLFKKPQRYAQFLGLELAFVYRDRLLVVTPGGYGYAIGGDPDPAASRVLQALPPPGADATKEVEAATVAVQRLATAAGLEIDAHPGGGSRAKDRIAIAAAATAGIALIAALVLYRRRRQPPATT
jgi:hypothetical protein